MATMTFSGRTALAVAVKNSVLHFAWGRGESWWDQDRNDILTFSAGGVVTLARGNVSGVVVKSQDEATTYVLGDDFTVNATAGTITRVADGDIAAGATVRVAYRTIRPTPLPNVTGLTDEVGRRVVTQTQFVSPDEAGSIVTPSGRWSVSATPTRWLNVRTVFAFDEGDGETIREAGIFLGSVPVTGLPPGQSYFEPDEIGNPGILLSIEHYGPLIRNGATQQAFEAVLTF